MDMNSGFPKLEGDRVTFIGSTFMKYGETKPYLNHCLKYQTSKSIHVQQNKTWNILRLSLDSIYILDMI